MENLVHQADCELGEFQQLMMTMQQQHQAATSSNDHRHNGKNDKEGVASDSRKTNRRGTNFELQKCDNNKFEYALFLTENDQMSFIAFDMSEDCI